MTGNRVDIVISEGHNYVESVNSGAAYTSIGYNAATYGGASPCDNEDEINLAITHAKETIERYGDKPVIVDQRKKATLMNWR